MKKITFFITAALFAVLFGVNAAFAQSSDEFKKWKEQHSKEFQSYSEQREKEFRDFRAKANAEYAEFLSRRWEEFRALQGIPAPKAPEPEKPPVADPKKKPTADPLPFKEVTPIPAPAPRPQPVAPIPQPVPEAAKPAFSFLYYGTECRVNLDNAQRFSLSDASEQSVAQAWKTLSDNRYDALVGSCLALRDHLNLSDWGYMLLLKTMSENFLGKASNEAVLLQMFILTQSGYKVRIARTGNRLALLIPFQETIYEHVFLNIEGAKYYVVNKELKGQSFYISNQEFPKEQHFSWRTEQPKLAQKLAAPKTFASKRYPEVSASVQTDQNLIDFYNSYPLSSEWNLYARAGLSKTAKQTLYPALQRAIAGKSKTEAAEMLLNFLQTSFAYQTDAEQFGYERPFFADENFYYPYNNCKDRAILYAILVKDLLGLEVVLLHYPGSSVPGGIGHLATAVHFPESVNGDYLTVNGKKFVVCDPTYIGASIGMTMDTYKRVSANVISL
jgi:hypothetical protein